MILLALVYGYLTLLFQSRFLLITEFAMLGGNSIPGTLYCIRALYLVDCSDNFCVTLLGFQLPHTRRHSRGGRKRAQSRRDELRGMRFVRDIG